MRYEVIVSVTDPASGVEIVSQKHPCLTVVDARGLLENIRELVEEMVAYLPGLAVAAYEVEETVRLTPAGLAALAEALPAERRDTRWWAQALGK